MVKNDRDTGDKPIGIDRDVPLVRELVELNRDGISSKFHPSEDGSTRGGKPFTRSALYSLLANRNCLGEVAYKGAIYPSGHDGIVERDPWDHIQHVLPPTVSSLGTSPECLTRACSPA